MSCSRRGVGASARARSGIGQRALTRGHCDRDGRGSTACIRARPSALGGGRSVRLDYGTKALDVS